MASDRLLTIDKFLREVYPVSEQLSVPSICKPSQGRKSILWKKTIASIASMVSIGKFSAFPKLFSGKFGSKIWQWHQEAGNQSASKSQGVMEWCGSC
jgi:hypothetical protein